MQAIIIVAIIENKISPNKKFARPYFAVDRPIYIYYK